MCVIDETIAFMGGFDLCFGRWDTPGHTLIDDGTVGLEAIDKAFNGEGPAVDEDDVQIWPGKGASAKRICSHLCTKSPSATCAEPWR